MNAGRKPSGRIPGKALVLGSGRGLTAIAAVMAVVMAVGLMSAPRAFAEPPNLGRPTVDDRQEPVAGRNLKAKPRKTDPAASKPGPPAKAAWPTPGSADVSVPTGSPSTRSATADGQKAGDLPIEILAAPRRKRAPNGVEPAARVRVQVLDRGATRAAGVDGLAFTVARTDATAPGRVKVRLDYSKFAQAFGGAYGPRLRLMEMPRCALTTPSKPGCRTPVPLETVNNGEANTLTAEVRAAPAAASGSPAAASAPRDATLLVAAAGSESSQGDYKATSLEASATWKSGGNTGDFTWSYPMRVPPVPSGLTPKVAISYSSASVDGRTGNSNGQPSWVGEGFDLWPGFIERRYKSCEDDGAPKDEWGNSPGDQCWGYDNATVTWNGKGGELIKASDGTWRMKGDDGTKFEKLTSSSNGNGDDNGEYWKVTTTDGIQYFFGLNRLPGWTSGKPETNSTWTSPVFGDDSGEPCHDSTFAGSWCDQAYRWNLDYVVDPAGNAVNYTYAQETNHYGRNLKTEDETSYVRGGYLKTISYGLRKDAMFAKPPAQVVFTTSERCIPDASFDCAPSKIGDNPDRWWDVPWDLNCNSGQECKDGHGSVAPTFWSRKRLTKVTTQILTPDGSAYRPADSWSMDHEWKLADVERDLVLKEITHAGHAATDGGTVTLPKVTFNHIQLPNRLDKTGDDILPYIRYRLGAIYDESGGQIDIAYSDPDCSLSDLPTPETNTTRCMPRIWTPPGREDPITDWFHKYVVTSIIQTDRTGLSPDMATKYQYIGDAAWHFDSDDGLTKEKEKTWSQWRGYGHVRTLTGSHADPSTQVDDYFMRGMDGDRKTKSGGEKSVTVSDGEGGTHTDHDALAGFTLRTVQYTGPGGSVHAKTVNTPWRSQTASRTRSWGTTTANLVAVDTTRTWTAKDGGGWTETKTDNKYAGSGPGAGRITEVNDLGDTSTADDDKCTRTTYADNAGAWMVSFPSRVETVAVACTATPNRPAQVVSDTRAFYDGGEFGAAPSKGEVTKAEKLAGYEGTTPEYVTHAATVYDSFGRVTQVKDALGAATTTAYTDTHGLTTRKQTTTPPANPGDAATALTITEELDPAWGLPTRTTDANNLSTDLVYDGLGRLRKVWLPDRSKANNDDPSLEHEYRFAEGKIVAVTSKAIVAGQLRVTGIKLVDGWLRPRQVQVPGQSGRLISDTFHDDRGQVVKTYAAYPATGAPQPELFGVGTPGAVEQQTRIEYDGLGRKTVEKLTKGNGSQPDQELWRTTTAYGGGNRVSVTPPDGGTPTTTLSDAHGQVIERRQHKAATPTGDYDATRYTYTPAGEIASVTDPSGNTFTTTYDLRGRKTRTTDPDKGTTTFAYDDLDRVVSTTDARGKKVFTTYDGLGRKTATHAGSADGPLLTSFTYDTVRRGKGLAASATRHHNGAQYTSNIRDYDELGRVHTATVTIPQSEGPLAGTYSTVTEYNSDGTLQSFRPPIAGGLPYETLTHTYDALARPTRLTSSLGTYIDNVTYRSTGEVQIIDFGSPGKRAFQTFHYQYGTRRLERANTSREGINGYARSALYDYTAAGTITSITDTSHDGVDNQCFTYDHLQRLTEAWTQGTADACATEPATTLIGGPAPYWRSFTYDKAGNRAKETRHGIGGTADTVRTYTYAPPGQGNRLNQTTQTGPTGQRTDGYTYDATGNTTAIQTTDGGPAPSTQTFEWDTEGELAKVTENGNDATFINDAEGNRLIRKDPTGATLYLPGGTELRALSGASTATGTRYYTLAGQTVAMRASDGAVTYLTGDHQGTAQIAVNAATLQSTVRRFTPFGSIRGMDEDATWPNDKGFVGGTQDPTGLTHLGAREYDPETGRFISVDPIMDQADPQQMNGYTYANNNPVTHADPDGQCPPDICGAGVINVGHSKPAKSGGCGRERCVRAGRADDVARSSWRPVRTKIGATVINARSAAAYRAAYLSALLLREKSPYWVDKHDPLPTCTPGAAGAVNGACSPGDIDILTRFGDLVCKVGGFKCSHISSRNYFKLGLAGFMPGGEGIGGGHPGGIRVGKPSRTQKLGSCSSFVPGTTVLMADGTRKPIEKVKVGDKVLATDPETGETSGQPVLAAITSKGDKNLVQITIDGRATPVPATTDQGAKYNTAGTFMFAKSGVIIATGNHPFWVAGDINDWVEAEDLKPGMWLRTSAGTYVQISATDLRPTHHQRVHNLTIANTHTYYVVSGGVSTLVHNQNCGTTAPVANPGTRFSVPDGPGVYTIHLNDGSKYVGSTLDSMRTRANKSMRSKHAVRRAGYSREKVVNVTWIPLPGVTDPVVARRLEQTVMEGLKGRGARLINRRDPEVAVPFGGYLP